MIVRMGTEKLKWLCLILTEIFTLKKCEVEFIIFIFVAFLYIRTHAGNMGLFVTCIGAFLKFDMCHGA